MACSAGGHRDAAASQRNEPFMLRAKVAHFPKRANIFVDKSAGKSFNSLAVQTRPYLSWIEDLTTNQGVVGSNPTGRATGFSGGFHHRRWEPPCSSSHKIRRCPKTAEMRRNSGSNCGRRNRPQSRYSSKTVKLGGLTGFSHVFRAIQLYENHIAEMRFLAHSLYAFLAEE